MEYFRVVGYLLRGSATLSSICSYPIRKRMQGISQIKLNSGITLTAPSTEPLLPIFEEVWVQRRYDQSGLQASANDVIVDIGAHVGIFTVWAATRWPAARIVSVEPSSLGAEYLRRNIAHNRLQNVTFVEACCTDHNGHVQLQARGEGARNTIYSRDNYHSVFTANENVPSLTLETIFREQKIDTCRLLKMDCEGAEYDILFSTPDSVLKKIQRISMEYHVGLNEHHPQELVSWLQSRGFEAKLSPLIDEEGGYLQACR